MYMEYNMIIWDKIFFGIIVFFSLLGILIISINVEWKIQRQAYEDSIQEFRSELLHEKEDINFHDTIIEIEEFFEQLVRTQYEQKWGYKYLWFEIRVIPAWIMYRVHYSFPNALWFQSKRKQEFIFSQEWKLLYKLN